MKRIFPEMYDRPENFMPFAAFGYWIFAFVLIPLFMPLIGDGLWTNPKAASWLEFIYHVINALVIVGMFRPYLRDSFLNVQLDIGKFLKTVGIAVLLMLALALPLILSLALTPYFFPFPMVADAYPMNEMSIAVSSGVMVDKLPVFGTLCHVLFAPVAVVGLYYAVGFAPMCCRKSWLGYLVVTGLLMLPSAFDILWRGNAEYVVCVFLLQLPIHLIACWSYQKADTVWAPIVTLSVFNLITSLCGIFLT